MIAHLTVGIDSAMWWKRVALCVFFLEGLGPNDLQESLIVFGALEDLLFVYATEDGVIDSCVGCFSCGSWHGRGQGLYYGVRGGVRGGGLGVTHHLDLHP